MSILTRLVHEFRWRNEAVGNDWLRDEIARREAELDEMRRVLARHEGRERRFRSDLLREKGGGK